MCVRNAYSCTTCKLVFPMPQGQSLGRRILCRWLKLGQTKQEPRTDLLCKNQFCLRKTEEGYRLCLNMNEPCWFCLRFGHEDLCRNRLMHVLCEKCFYASRDSSSPSTTRYPYPLHYRRQERPQQDFYYTDLYTQDEDYPFDQVDKSTTTTTPHPTSSPSK